MVALGLALPIGLGVSFAAVDEETQRIGSLLNSNIHDKRTMTSDLSEDVAAVHVVNAKGTVTIRPPKDGEKPHVSGEYGESSDASLNPTLTVVDGVLRLDSGCGSDSDHWFVDCGGNWTLVVPAATDVAVRSGAGEVIVSGMAGDVEVRQGVGLAAVKDYTGDKVLVETSVGEAAVDCHSAPVSVEVSVDVGDVNIASPESVNSAVIFTETALGDTRVTPTHDPHASSSFTATVNLGSVTIT